MGITQDKQGFLWFSTESGLNRFDGKKFRIYKKNDLLTPLRSISGNELNTVYADKYDDKIWTATQRNGLNVFDCRTETFKHYKNNPNDPNSIITNDITDIVNANDGNLWIATYYGGFEYFDKKSQKFTHYNRSTLPGLISNSIWSIVEDEKGTVYLGHVSQGMSVISGDRKTVKNYRNDPANPNSLPGNVVNVVYIDKSGNVWVGTDSGLALFDPSTQRFRTFKHAPGNQRSLIADHVLSITQLRNEDLCIGTENGGVSILDIKTNMFSSPEQTEFRNISQGDAVYTLSNQTIRRIFQDSFDNIWIGTYGGGINFISHTSSFFNKWSYSPIPTIENRLSNKTAWGICSDKDGQIWVGTDGGGIDVFREDLKIKALNTANSNLTDNAVLAAFRDSRNDLWFGTFEGGVNVYDTKKSRLTALPLASVTNVRCFSEDKDGYIWVGSSSGIHVLNRSKKRVKFYTKENIYLKENLVRSLYHDALGRIWVGFFGGGLAIYNSDMQLLHDFDTNKNLPSNMVNYIYGDRRGKVWVGTAEGLVCFTEEKQNFRFSSFTEKDGLADSHIRGITEDGEGNIWVSTTRGISFLRVNDSKIFNYDRREGVPLGDFMSGSVAKGRDNKIYFGSKGGVCYFDPTKIPIKINLPQTIITDFAIYDSALEPSGNIQYLPITQKMLLDHDQSTFEVSFNILDYSLHQRVEYSYMLKGLKEVWYNCGEQNTITFRNIPHGSYTLMIRSRIRNQEWRNDVSVLDIEIGPPLWLTWWAKVVYVFSFMGLLFFVLRFYKRRLELENSLVLEKQNNQNELKLHQERLSFFTNITHELRTPLTLILGPLEDLKLQMGDSSVYFSKITTIHKSANRLLKLINQILEFRKADTENKDLYIKKDNLAMLVEEIFLKYRALNQNEKLSFELYVEKDEYNLHYDPDIMTTVLENLISNAAKYTSEGKICLTLRHNRSKESNLVEIEVADTGRGIHADALPQIFDSYFQEKGNMKTGTGLGLALVRKLIQLHQGEITVESMLGKGSVFRFTIDADNRYPHALMLTDEEFKGVDEKAQSQEEVDSREIILVIEDHEDINAYIVDSLSDRYTVHHALHGNEGLEKAYALIPDLIISDIMMPYLDGISLMKKLKEDVRTSHIPIILLTAKDTTESRIEGYEMGADSFIAKPFSARLLKSRILNIFESRKKLLLDLTKNENLKSNVLHASLNQIDREFLEKIRLIIEGSIQTDSLDVDFIATELFMSHSTLYRKIKALTGMTINEFIRKVRISQAEKFFLTGRYTVSEVCYMVGFNSLPYFRQCFKDEFGMNPTDYIKKLKKET
ncbi:hybrid sensor histidine kinase/response regulator [Sphingobacterium alkalisoli]|nr:hybrid sensor histidine kinase/response regulator [Sphingobacterium alkalisoli]